MAKHNAIPQGYMTVGETAKNGGGGPSAPLQY